MTCYLAPSFSLTAGKAGAPPLEVARNYTKAWTDPHFPAFVENSSWVWAEDRRGKPGWIALPGSRGRVRFEVNAKLGWALIGYLQTYTDVGIASCTLGDGSVQEVDARITNTVSVIGTFVLRANQARGRMNVTCWTDGRKFKISSVMSC